MDLTEWFCPWWLFSPSVRKKFYISDEQLVDNTLVVGNCDLCAQFSDVWSKCEIRVSADGGSNKIHDWNTEHKTTFFPDYCIGDFDSIKDEVKESLIKKGTKVLLVQSQDSTDLDKAIDLIEGTSEHSSSFPAFNSKNIIITGVFGGNISQELKNLDSCLNRKRKYFLISDDNVVLILPPGDHIINSPINMKCGLIPLSNTPGIVTTKGLKWNLNSSILSFGILLSTSNVTVSTQVHVSTTNYLIWTFDCH